MLTKTLRCGALALLASASVPLFGAPRALPVEVQLALERARLPAESISLMVQEVGARQTRLAWQADQSVNPASLMKLFNTFAALELLGPSWTWTTPVWLHGSVSNGVLDGHLVIKGSGDPKLVLERMWLLLRKVQQMGVNEIRGDIILDRSAFNLPEQNPADFDGEPLRPYNVGADALLLNFKSIAYTFTPDPQRGVAWVAVDPPLAGARTEPAAVPLVQGGCHNWRGDLKAEFGDPLRIRFNGSFPTSCGEKLWALAHADAKAYNERALVGLWQEMGGTFSGKVRDGTAPDTRPSFELSSPALSEVVRDINKFSNNVMAQQLFLTLGLAQRGAGTPQMSRDVLRQWMAQRLGASEAAAVTIDNGSGLSRESRATPQAMVRLLQAAWSSPVMPELLSSLPVSGVDGTLRRSRSTPGRAHLKTGSLRDVAGIAGYVLSTSGRRYVVVAVVNHPNASAARPALDALVQWTIDGASASTGTLQ